MNDSSDVMVRRAAPRDSDDAVRLLRQLGYPRDRDAVERDLRGTGAGVVYVSVHNGEVVGLLALSVRYQFHWGASIASIDALIVDRTVRSRGVGAALLDAAADHARAHDCILVEVHSNRRRRRARQFYQRHGFEATSVYLVRHLT